MNIDPKIFSKILSNWIQQYVKRIIWQKQKILRRGGKNTQNCTKKGLNDQDNHDGVIIHLEPDLECEVKWALGSLLGTELVEVMEF